MRVLRLAYSALWLLIAADVAADEAPMRVSATRALRVAVVDTHAAPFAREDLSRGVTERMRAWLQRRVGGDVALRSESVDARAAAARLQAGACDAVLILGAERPRALRRTETATLATEFGTEGNFEPVYLVLAAGDVALQQLLTESFPLAVREVTLRSEVVAAQ
jgi:hypothetical protein